MKIFKLVWKNQIIMRKNILIFDPINDMTFKNLRLWKERSLFGNDHKILLHHYLSNNLS